MNIPSIESLLSELDKYKRAYESCDAQILSLKEQRNRLTAERDAALAVAKEAQANDRCAMGYLSQVRAVVGGSDFPDMVERVATLKSALREAKEALTPYMKFVDGTQVKNHPAQVYDRINKVLGEE